VALNSRLLLPLRRAIATIFSARGRRSASKAWKVAPSSWPSCIRRANRIASSRASEAPWPACGLVACAASPISSERLRDQVGSVATSSVSVTTMFSAASMMAGIGSCQP
jgi:hypothetical protein